MAIGNIVANSELFKRTPHMAKFNNQGAVLLAMPEGDSGQGRWGYDGNSGDDESPESSTQGNNSPSGALPGPGSNVQKAALVSLLLILVLSGIYVMLSGPPQENAIEVSVKNPAGVAIKGALVTVSFSGNAGPQNAEPLSLETGDDGLVVFRARNGADFEITVSKQGYADENRSGTAGSEQGTIEFNLALAAPSGPAEIVISFAGPDGRKITEQEVVASLKCTGNAKFGQDEYKARDGELRVQVPEGCGKVSITATTAGMKAASSVLFASESIVKFDGIQRQKGKIQFDVRDSVTGEFIDGIAITIKGQLGGTVATQETSFGEASFVLEAGDYTAVLSDRKNRYASVSKQIEVNAGELQDKISARLSRDIMLNAKFLVSGKGSGPLNGALVSLFRETSLPDRQGQPEPQGEMLTGSDGNAACLQDHGQFQV
ncbi:Carboxypeptidase regulatory-like domain protein [uncultured archaeon]|nr:Carboxypeptidase regulatory-like domain protein [uncultured archaeon]